MKSVVVLLIFSVFSVGCSMTSYDYTDGKRALLYKNFFKDSIILAYEGPPKSFEEVGVFTKDHYIEIRSLNDKKIDEFKTYKSKGLTSDGRYQLHVLPGVYKLSVGIDGGDISQNLSSKSDIKQIIEIKKGQVIHLSMKRNGGMWSVRKTNGISAVKEMKEDFKELVN